MRACHTRGRARHAAQRRVSARAAGHLALSLLVLASCAGLERVQEIQRAAELHDAATEDFRRSQYAKGVANAEAALRLRENALGTEHPDVAASAHLLATLYRSQGKYEEAEGYYQRSLAVRARVFGPHDPRVADSLNHLALLYDARGRYEEAERLYRRSLEIRETALGPEHPSVAQSLNNLGVFIQGGGDLASARPLLERALRIWERAFGPRHPDVASGLNNLALLLHATGDYAGARPLLERALGIWEEQLGPHHPEVAYGLSNLARVFQSTGDYARARPLLERALRIREQALGPNHPAVAQSLTNMGGVLWLVGDYGAARARLEDALAIVERVLGPDHPEVATSLNNLGRALESLGHPGEAKSRYERALAIYERALGADHPNAAFTLNNLARVVRASGDDAAAQRLYERALRIREEVLGPAHPLVALSLNNLADLLRGRGNQAAAGPLYERALQIARAALTPEWEWRAAFGLGRIYEREGRVQAALALYRQAVQALERLAGQFEDEAARLQYLGGENKLDVYDALAQLLLRLHERDSTRGYDHEAWAVLEAKKGRIAGEALTAARPRFARPSAQRVQAWRDRALALEEALHAERSRAPTEQRGPRLQSLTALLARTKAEYVREVEGFLARYPQYRTQFVDQTTVDPKALAKFAGRLPAGTLAVQYFAAPDRLYLFVVAPPGRFQVLSQAVTREELYGLVRAYRYFVEQGTSGQLPWGDDGSPAYGRDVVPLKRLTRVLARYLLDPIEAELRTHANLVLIPNDLLLYLPVHALTREHPDGSVRFLAETHAVSYLTGLELVDLLAPAVSAPDAPLLALANPDGSLPGASQEIRALSRMRPSVTALEGPQATKARFLSVAAEFLDLHLATHGVLDLERPQESYLLMAGEDEDSQRLTVGEVAGLTLQDGLAVLSACETALGERIPGAGLITLAAAFSQAGSGSIVASLWKVSDASTRDFMVAFYRALPRAGRAAALQQAQLAVLRNARTAHPYYWAPFVLIGAR